VYVLFDLLWDNGRDLTGKSVVQRRGRLQEIITPVAGIKIGGYLEQRGIDLFLLAKEKGLEGIIAKRKGSTYQPGRALTGLAEDQITATARVRGVRLH
jgi:bifunctional non-homologous end joining protein LigD